MKKLIQMNFQHCLKIAHYCYLELTAHQFNKSTNLNPILPGVLGTEALPFPIRNTLQGDKNHKLEVGGFILL